MAITPNSNLAGLSGKIGLNKTTGQVQANPAALGVSAPTSVGVRAASPTTKATPPPINLPTAQKAPVQPTPAPVTYDYNTGKPLAPGQAQSAYNTQTGQKIGEPATAVSLGNSAAPSYPGLMGAQIQARNQQAQAAPQPTPTYSGLVGSLANNSLRQSPVAAQGAAGLINNAQTNYGTAGPAYQDYQTKVGELQKLKSGIAQQYGNIESQAIPLEFQQGREQALSRQYASQLDAGQQAVNQAQQAIGYQLTGNSQQQAGLTSAAGIGNTAQGQLQSGLTSAAGYAQPQQVGAGSVVYNPQTGLPITAGPTQLPYSNQYIDPLTGRPIGGGGGGGAATGTMASLPQAAQDAVNSYAQQVQNGLMSRADAESRLSTYGVAGTNALNEVLGTGFNTNASNASEHTTAVGQQIQTAADSTNKALDTLVQAFSSLSGLETGGIPVTNSIAQWVGRQLGDKGLQQYLTNLADARSQLIGVLNSSGGTPTGNESTANQYLPDNMTKAQFDTNVGTAEHPGIVRQLIAQKVGSFTNSGQQGGTTSRGPITTKNGLTIDPSL